MRHFRVSVHPEEAELALPGPPEALGIESDEYQRCQRRAGTVLLVPYYFLRIGVARDENNGSNGGGMGVQSMSAQEAKVKGLNTGGKMKRWKIYGLLLYSLSALSLYADPIVDLGTASSFAVLGGSTVTNTGNTVLWGNLGIFPGSAISGFYPPGIVNGTIYNDGPGGVAAGAQADARIAYDYLLTLAPTGGDLTGQNLGGLELLPGVYKFDSSAQLTGELTLNMLGDPNSLFVFQIGSTLKTAPGSSVTTINGEHCCNVYWAVYSSATLDTTTAFRGNILAQASITMNNGATITDGRALALDAAVTMDTNTITNVVCDTTNGAVPEPGTVALLGAGLFGLVLLGRRSRKRAA
jgi:hypothetical protein